jgi:uncharacterized SAM-binding protein YcdF (DUF218 family)
MFTLSKIMDCIDSPLNILFLITVTGVLLLFSSRPQRGRHLLVGLVLTGFGLMLIPLDEMLARRLEDRFPVLMIDHLDGIIVLGGAVDIEKSISRGRPSINGAAERITEMIVLIRRFPQAQVVFTGGSGSLGDQNHKEADILKELLIQMGIDTSRIVFENQSRNTHENAIMSKALVNPTPDQTWALVTSAGHMPRAVGCFRAAGWPVVAWPVNYQTINSGPHDLRDSFFSVGRFQTLANTLHEGLGLVYYYLRGWILTPFPAP